MKDAIESIVIWVLQRSPGYAGKKYTPQPAGGPIPGIHDGTETSVWSKPGPLGRLHLWWLRKYKTPPPRKSQSVFGEDYSTGKMTPTITLYVWMWDPVQGRPSMAHRTLKEKV